MLGKLIHYEMKAFGRIMLPLYAAALAFSLFMGLGLRFLPTDLLGGLPTVLMFMIYGFLMLAIMLMTTILAVTRFYNNLLGREGYLMFSLPAGTLSLISSKVISLVIWSFLSTLTAVLTIGICAVGAGGIDVLREIPNLVVYLSEWENLPEALRTIAVTSILLIFTTAAAIVKIYAAISVGHQFQGHRIAWSVVAYVCFNLIETAIRSIVALIESQTGVLEAWWNRYFLIFDAETVQAVRSIMWGGVGLSLVAILIYGALTWGLLDRRLNLE